MQWSTNTDFNLDKYQQTFLLLKTTARRRRNKKKYCARFACTHAQYNFDSAAVTANKH